MKVKASLTNIGSGNLDRISKKIAGKYEIMVGLPNNGQRYVYRAYEYGTQKKKGAKKQSATAKIEIDESAKPYPLIAEVGFWNEFGTSDGRIPERSFLRATIVKNIKRYLHMNRTLAIKVLRGELKLELGLKKFALVAANDVKETIRNFTSPPNAASTIKKKGTDSPLRYKSTLNRAITGFVRKIR